MRTKKAIKNIIMSLLLQSVSIICSFILPRMIIKEFGSDVNGLISSIGQFLGYITLLESGVGPVIKAALYKPISQKNKKEIANVLKASEKFFRRIAFIFIAYLFVLLIAFPIIINNQFDKCYTVSLLIIMAISTFIEYYFSITYSIYIQAEQKTYVTSGFQMFVTIVNTIVTILLIKNGYSIQLVKLVSAFIFVLRPIFLNLYIKKNYNINLKEVDDNYNLEQKWDGLAQHIASIIHNNTDITILTLFTNMKEVSVYSVYILIVNGVKSLTKSFTGGIDAAFGDMIAKKEKVTLNKSFRTFEIFYFSIATIFFTAALLLIVPFVSIYTSGITDANYYRPLFAYLLVLSEFMWTIRLPYSSLILAAGHFKETKKGAWLEAGINVVLSMFLVFKFGIVGVAIGTFIAMFIRTLEFMYHSSKYILDRNIWHSLKILLSIIVEVMLIILIVNFMPYKEITTYSAWIAQAVIITSITSLVVISINFLLYKSDIKDVLEMVKRKFLNWKVKN